jgi:hypothetical protein
VNNLINNKHSIFGLLGDFWYRQLSEDNPNGVALARALTHLLDANNAVSNLSNTANKLSGSLQNYKFNFNIKFNPKDVSVINIDLQQRDKAGVYPSVTITRPSQYTLFRSGGLKVESLSADATPEVYTAPSEDLLGDVDSEMFILDLGDANVNFYFSPDDARPLYFLPIEGNILPAVIATNDKELTVNTSFITNNGYIIFFEDPAVLFPDNFIFCRSALVLESHVMDYTYQVDNLYSSGYYVTRYMRDTHSPVALRLALAEVAGLPIVKQDSILLAYYENPNFTVYEFDNEVLKVPSYIEHTQLTVGTTYSAGTIIGEDYIKVFSPANTSYNPWYRTAELDDVWSVNGLDLSAVTPFTVSLPDTTGTFAANGTPSTTAHLLLTGLTGSQTAAYWNFVRQSESHTDRFLANISGVTAGATANIIDFYFENMLQYSSVIIKLRTMELGSEIHGNVISFIQRDLPINVTPFILS